MEVLTTLQSTPEVQEPLRTVPQEGLPVLPQEQLPGPLVQGQAGMADLVLKARLSMDRAEEAEAAGMALMEPQQSAEMVVQDSVHLSRDHQ